MSKQCLINIALDKQKLFENSIERGSKLPGIKPRHQ